MVAEYPDVLGFTLAQDKTAVGQWRIESRKGGPARRRNHQRHNRFRREPGLTSTTRGLALPGVENSLLGDGRDIDALPPPRFLGQQRSAEIVCLGRPVAAGVRYGGVDWATVFVLDGQDRLIEWTG